MDAKESSQEFVAVKASCCQTDFLESSLKPTSSFQALGTNTKEDSCSFIFVSDQESTTNQQVTFM